MEQKTVQGSQTQIPQSEIQKAKKRTREEIEGDEEEEEEIFEGTNEEAPSTQPKKKARRTEPKKKARHGRTWNSIRKAADKKAAEEGIPIPNPSPFNQMFKDLNAQMIVAEMANIEVYLENLKDHQKGIPFNHRKCLKKQSEIFSMVAGVLWKKSNEKE